MVFRKTGDEPEDYSIERAFEAARAQGLTGTAASVVVRPDLLEFEGGKARLRDDVAIWCRDQLDDGHELRSAVYHRTADYECRVWFMVFETMAEAMHFKLRWQ